MTDPVTINMDNSSREMQQAASSKHKNINNQVLKMIKVVKKPGNQQTHTQKDFYITTAKMTSRNEWISMNLHDHY
ncbi:hypothetical protein BDC45DRAFT_523283 [Circinella umbellata]|nr:hypothetical protein BDC45DRAFT_523283 [Circinella umbellata]